MYRSNVYINSVTCLRPATHTENYLTIFVSLQYDITSSHMEMLCFSQMLCTCMCFYTWTDLVLCWHFLTDYYSLFIYLNRKKKSVSNFHNISLLLLTLFDLMVELGCCHECGFIKLVWTKGIHFQFGVSSQFPLHKQSKSSKHRVYNTNIWYLKKVIISCHWVVNAQVFTNLCFMFYFVYIGQRHFGKIKLRW